MTGNSNHPLFVFPEKKKKKEQLHLNSLLPIISWVNVLDIYPLTPEKKKKEKKKKKKKETEIV